MHLYISHFPSKLSSLIYQPKILTLFQMSNIFLALIFALCFINFASAVSIATVCKPEDRTQGLRFCPMFMADMRIQNADGTFHDMKGNGCRLCLNPQVKQYAMGACAEFFSLMTGY